jgi:predicted nucleic acid-binding protein
LLDIDFSIIAEGSSLEKLVHRYADVPMSLADACLVRLAKTYPHTIVFTLDTDFHIYRRDGRQAIQLLMP